MLASLLANKPRSTLRRNQITHPYNLLPISSCSTYLVQKLQILHLK